MVQMMNEYSYRIVETYGQYFISPLNCAHKRMHKFAEFAQ